MADSNTETATTPETGGDAASKGSEFSRPGGEKDDEVWSKHFGGKAESGKRPSGERKTSPASSDSKSASSATSSTKSAKESEATGAKASSTSKDTKPDKSPEAKSKEPKDAKAKDSTDAAGGKTAKDDDPEAPSKEARDLFEQAKKTEDRREARKLYKRALVKAFGEVPEEFDDRKYAAVRTERAAAKAALDEQAKKNEGRISEAAEKLKPAIFVMRKLEAAKFGDGKLTVPLVERAIHVMHALRSVEDGDYTQLAEVIARASGVDHDEAMKRFVRGVKVSPEGKAARQAAQQAEQRAIQAEQRIQEMERRLQEKETTQTEAQKLQAKRDQANQVRNQWLDDIETELDGHPVLQLQRGKERVLAYLIKTAHPTLKTARFSKEEAANRVVAHEKRRLQGSRFLLGEGDEAPQREEPRQLRQSTPRSAQADSGVRSTDPIERFNEIFDRRTAAGRKR